jgi:hypothetical protein
MTLIPSSWGQWVAAIVALFLVPAAGSAFWDFVAKPLLLGTVSRVRTTTMKLVTLGSQRAERRLFLSVARRDVVHPAVGFWVIAYFAAITQAAEITGRFSGPRLGARLSTIAIYYWHPAIFVAAALFIILPLYHLTRTKVIVSYIRDFEHVLDIVSPTLSEHERLVVRSNFALIKSASDYEAVVEELFRKSEAYQETSRESVREAETKVVADGAI